ncbi:MAG: histidinol-phosphatase [Candidatus Delongbacteria bacterium]|nr:histidinol-phosphatase [Candidatus Delongbacteria bacterium]
MKKIDLHIHTISTISDYEFIFSIEKLKEYVQTQNINAIAITNHNIFDLEQFREIDEALSIDVFPGIEINLECGHLLLISDNNELDAFNDKCQQVEDKIVTAEDSISIGEMDEIFHDLSKYLLIPHYDKKPSLRQEKLNELSSYINAGEVTSIKKFIYHTKNADSLVPVIFSDSRLTEEISSFPTRQTYIDLQDISFAGIKSCLNDKYKVALSEEHGNDFFQATSDGLLLSTGLNIILGERSSGKTFTLDKISEENENVKYIKQFSLLQNDEQRFNEQLATEESRVTEDYLKEFKEVVDDVVGIDLSAHFREMDDYLSSLLTYASESEKADTYSKTALFNESRYALKDLSNLQKLIEATELLLENEEYKEIINTHISKENLKSLLLDLIKKIHTEQEDKLKQQWLNDLIDNTKRALQTRSAQTIIEDINLYQIAVECKKIEKFSEVVELLKIEKNIYSKDIGKFKIIAKTKQYQGAQELKNKSGRQWRFASAFQNYNNPYNFLCELKNIEQLRKTEYYKYFMDVQYQILNRHGYPVSGGERSEFNLLNEIKDALKHDILLIDEPESSFDNQFLKSEVNKLIKELSKEIPIVLVTHNNTVGASIKPDYLIHTKREIRDGEVNYKLFSGYPSDKELKSTDSESINNYLIMMNCLEAGSETYEKRRSDIYEILKD